MNSSQARLMRGRVSADTMLTAGLSLRAALILLRGSLFRPLTLHMTLQGKPLEEVSIETCDTNLCVCVCMYVCMCLCLCLWVWVWVWVWVGLRE